MRHSYRLRLVAAVCLLALGGCYVYTPVQTPTPGTEVRVEVPLRSAAQGRSPQGSAVLEGIVVSSGETLVLETRNRQQAGFMQEMLLVDTVRMATDDLIRLDARSFSGTRTAVFTAGLVAGVVLVATGITSLVGGDEGGEPGNGDPAQRRGPGTDILRIRLPFGGR